MPGENPDRIRNILVVCLGNICRSPMAEAVLQRRLDKRARVSSAGFLESGNPASQPAEQVMLEMGYDLSGHLSRRIDKSIVSGQDLILTMEEEQAVKIIEKYKPPVICESFVHYATGGNERGDVFDPYGESVEVYRRVALRIRRLADKAADRMLDEGFILPGRPAG